jgi:hypothetical protein
LLKIITVKTGSTRRDRCSLPETSNHVTPKLGFLSRSARESRSLGWVTSLHHDPKGLLKQTRCERRERHKLVETQVIKEATDPQSDGFEACEPDDATTGVPGGDREPERRQRPPTNSPLKTHS